MYWGAIFWIFLVIFAAVFATLLPIRSDDVIVPGLAPGTPPGWRAEFLGTDSIGLSVLSRIIDGARDTMIVGLSAVVLSMTVGMAIGLVAGYARGKTDEVIGVLLDAVLSIPALVLLLAVASVGNQNLPTLIIGLSIVGVPSTARLTRGVTLSIVDRDFVTAARVMGATSIRIMTREILPNVILRILPYAFLYMGFVIVAEGSLSYLGLGIPPPAPSWGGMIAASQDFLETKPYLVFVPAACMFLTVAAFTVVGDDASRRFDVRRSVFQ
jgi:peptide/nickel transport system permease protein